MQIAIEPNGAVLTGTITNPPDGFMDPVTEEELVALLEQVDSDDGVRAGCRTLSFVTMTSVSCRRQAERMVGREMRFETTRSVPEPPYHICLRLITGSPVAFIAAINGAPMADDFELALACDI